MNLEQPDVTNKITVTTQVDPHTKAGYETSETVTVLPEKFYIEIDQDGNICLTTTWVGHGNTEVWKGTLKDDTLSGKYSLEKSSGRDVEYDFALTSF